MTKSGGERKRMKLGIFVDYRGARVQIPVDLVQLAERLGFDSVWTAEAYGSDAITPLAYLAAITKRIRLGTGILQIAARAPAMAAMQAGTLDQLAGEGRVVIGLGVSGPQIVEGWYGQPWGRPYWRMRDYVDIMRKVLRRERPVTHDGRELRLPYDGTGALGLGKPLKSILHMNPSIPIWLATGSETMVKLTAEIADGWLPMGFAPGMMKVYRPWLEAGFQRAGNNKSWSNFEIQAQAFVILCDDVGAALRSLKPMAALYVGGMGHKTMNFHKDQMVRRGYSEAAERIQELFMSGRTAEAIDAVPDEYIDEGSLIGPPQRIRQRYRAWEESGATGLTIHTSQMEAVELLAELGETGRS